ncbi:UNVERIFIED_CONTAM: hypothetical protein ABID98_002368 [Brevibacillus sp. OAP136]
MFDEGDSQTLLEYLKSVFSDDPDFKVRHVPVLDGQATITVVYIEGLVENDVLNKQIIERVQDSRRDDECKPSWSQLMDFISSNIISLSSVYCSADQNHIVDAILTGNVILAIDDAETVLVTGIRKQEKAEKAEVEPSLQSGNEAFSSDINKNYALLRKRLPSSELKCKQLVVGRISRTRVRIVWLDSVANPKIVDEVWQRINRIDIDTVHSISVITELTEDSPLSIWPQYRMTERLDVTAANLADGHVAILCDNFSFVVIVPIFILEEFQASDDYSQKWIFASMTRIIRYFAFFISSTLSSLYLSFATINHSIMPPALAIRISAGRQDVPFPSVIELLLMTLTIDLLREAGIRLPRALGSAIGILGAVVIGQSAVQAGYVSPVVIIVISMSAISSFVLPSIYISNVSRFLNYFLILLAAFFGLFGVIIGLIYMLWRLFCIRSFGVPIAHRLGSGELSLMKDIWVRFPLWKLRNRPRLLTENDTAMGKSTGKPGPEK